MPHDVVKEICNRLRELSEHAAILEAVADRLDARNFDLACRYDSSVSMTTWLKERGIVHLAINNGHGARTVLFDLLHELGHVQTGEETVHHRVEDVDYKREQVRRETEAWAHGERALIELGLGHYQEEFVARRDYCLATYGIRSNLATPGLVRR